MCVSAHRHIHLHIHTPSQFSFSWDPWLRQRTTLKSYVRNWGEWLSLGNGMREKKDTLYTSFLKLFKFLDLIVHFYNLKLKLHLKKVNNGNFPSHSYPCPSPPGSTFPRFRWPLYYLLVCSCGAICMLLIVVRSLSRVWLCNPMDCSTPDLPVLRYLLEFAQTHVHRAGDAL